MNWIEVLVPAAGFSSRMQHTNKLLLKLDKLTVIEHTVNNLLSSGVGGITVIVGSHRAEIIKVLSRYPVKILDNPYYKEGMSTSIKYGVEFFKYIPETEAALVMPADMPLITPGTINSILNIYRKRSSLITAPFYQGKRGHPVLFKRCLFNELKNISGDKGAREVVKKYEKELSGVHVEDPGILTDIDSWEEYLAVKKYFNKGSITVQL